jgi:sporulation protein YlmC with PRC-barrel domain
VRCTDEVFGELADVVIDPTTRRVTDLVVQPSHRHGLARLVPIELARARDETDDALLLRCTVGEVRRFSPVQELAYLRLGEATIDDPDWEVGIEEVLALPYYSPLGLEPTPTDVTLVYDRIPKGDVEIRRASTVISSDGHGLGHVDGFIVDEDEHITHLVLERGHLWGRREVTIPIGAVERVDTDLVTLGLTKDEVGELMPVAVHRHQKS